MHYDFAALLVTKCGLRSYKTEPQIWDSKDGCKHEWQPSDVLRHNLGDNDARCGFKPNSKAPSAERILPSNTCLKCGAWRGELGLEPTIEFYIKHLIQIFNEVKRVLKKTGTCWVNIDDSYAAQKSTGSYGKNRDYAPLDNMPKFQFSMPPKSLCLIPSRFALAMVESGWILRNDIVWNKPNPMPESVKDRFTGSWEHLFFFVKSKRYFFEQQFEKADPSTQRDKPVNATEAVGNTSQGDRRVNYEKTRHIVYERNARDICEISTQPSDYDYCLKCDTYFTGKRRSSIQTVIIDDKPKKKCPVCGSTDDWLGHFATFPEKLCETPILAGCPSQICKKCGKAREKIYEYERIPEKCKRNDAGDETFRNFDGERWNTKTIDKGYTDCGCNAGFEAGVVLDPCAGSGTTGAVAKKLGRRYIGIDISENYCKLHVKRLQEIPLAMELG